MINNPLQCVLQQNECHTHITYKHLLFSLALHYTVQGQYIYTDTDNGYFELYINEYHRIETITVLSKNVSTIITPIATCMYMLNITLNSCILTLTCAITIYSLLK